MKVKNGFALAATILITTGCASINNAMPSADTATIRKSDGRGGLDVSGASQWRYKVEKVEDSSGNVLYEKSWNSLPNPFEQMYISVPAGEYKVRTTCFLFTTADNFYPTSSIHNLNIEGKTQIKFDIELQGNICNTKVRERNYS